MSNKSADEVQTNDENNCDRWKAFKNTEAGILLHRLYGNKHQSISKPTFRRKRRQSCHQETRAIVNEPWRIVNSKPGFANPSNLKFDHIKAKSVKTPSFRNKSSFKQMYAVDLIPRRKSQQKCKVLVERQEELKGYFRPGNRPNFSCDDEKKRLSNIFECKGGKSLPMELTFPEQETPEEKMWRLKEEHRIKEARQSRLTKHSIINSNDESIISKEEIQLPNNDTDSLNQLYDQIVQEINERRAYQTEMEKLGAGNRTREKVSKEIASRMSQLYKLDAIKAKELKIS